MDPLHDGLYEYNGTQSILRRSNLVSPVMNSLYHARSTTYWGCQRVLSDCVFVADYMIDRNNKEVGGCLVSRARNVWTVNKKRAALSGCTHVMPLAHIVHGQNKQLRTYLFADASEVMQDSEAEFTDGDIFKTSSLVGLIKACSNYLTEAVKQHGQHTPLPVEYDDYYPVVDGIHHLKLDPILSRIFRKGVAASIEDPEKVSNLSWMPQFKPAPEGLTEDKALKQNLSTAKQRADITPQKVESAKAGKRGGRRAKGRGDVSDGGNTENETDAGETPRKRVRTAPPSKVRFNPDVQTGGVSGAVSAELLAACGQIPMTVSEKLAPVAEQLKAAAIKCASASASSATACEKTAEAADKLVTNSATVSASTTAFVDAMKECTRDLKVQAEKAKEAAEQMTESTQELKTAAAALGRASNEIATAASVIHTAVNAMHAANKGVREDEQKH